MAYGLLPSPGKKREIGGVMREIGPCVEPCAHIDCARTRRDADSPCRICGRAIGYETPFYQEGGAVLVHADCAEDEVETARKPR